MLPVHLSIHLLPPSQLPAHWNGLKEWAWTPIGGSSQASASLLPTSDTIEHSHFCSFLLLLEEVMAFCKSTGSASLSAIILLGVWKQILPTVDTESYSNMTQQCDCPQSWPWNDRNLSIPVAAWQMLHCLGPGDLYTINTQTRATWRHNSHIYALKHNQEHTQKNKSRQVCTENSYI